jgi:hypothetical protein
MAKQDLQYDFQLSSGRGIILWCDDGADFQLLTSRELIQ